MPYPYTKPIPNPNLNPNPSQARVELCPREGGARLAVRSPSLVTPISGPRAAGTGERLRECPLLSTPWSIAAKLPKLPAPSYQSYHRGQVTEVTCADHRVMGASQWTYAPWYGLVMTDRLNAPDAITQLLHRRYIAVTQPLHSR